MHDHSKENSTNLKISEINTKNRSENLKLKIAGLDCVEEVAILKKVVGPLVGGEDRLSFDILNGLMFIPSSMTKNTIDSIFIEIKKTGMSAKIWETESEKKDDNEPQRRSKKLFTQLSGLFTMLGYLAHAWILQSFLTPLTGEFKSLNSIPIIVLIFFGIAIVTGTWFVLPKAKYALKSLSPDINLLMVIAVIGAMCIGDWFEAASVAFLYSLSLTLETWNIGRARKAVASLLKMAPTVVRIYRRNGPEVSMPPERVAIGSTFIVRPGEKLPLDGIIIEGTSELNQAAITGESKPVLKRTGDAVFAGTINGDGALKIKSTKLSNETAIANIVRMVGDAQSKRAPSEQWVEKFARIYTPFIIVTALIVLLGPPLIFHSQWKEWIYNSLVLIVVACPCALVISTPVTIAAAMAGAARNGVLIKGGLYVETPARLKAIALDKTGTLTSGKAQVTNVVPMNGHDRKELLKIAATLENGSTHPIAMAICETARIERVNPRTVSDFQIIQGKGARGKIGGTEYWLGSHRYLEERKEETPEIHNSLEELASSGQTVVVIGDGKHVCGFISLADDVRPQARETVEKLRKIGISEVVMLTGDNEGTAKIIAKETGVTSYQAELLPSDKVKAVEQLMGKHSFVAMVGDGVNDAPAMARSSLGIAMGAIGSDAAIETADIALMSDDLTKIHWLIQHSKRAVGIVKQNIYFSIGIKALFILLTIGGFASLWGAILADMGTSMIVIMNGVRLLKAT